ncbi:DUF6262 family protein [Streptomyces sp. NBC_01334]|uniref:DUF6262 family protein n=1 Tax=Streptomyces sp. NBC_01334 TaxID=2903827 RepID=UPI002E12548F|nr:DUF6262 family protein [Streptomyces sp. NBC_01334]
MKPTAPEAAIAARRQLTEQKLDGMKTAIAQLRREGGRLSVRAIAQRAGVSATFCYENNSARALVRQAVADSRSSRDRTSLEEHDRVEATWRERALNAENELNRAQREVLAQRERIAELMGRARDAETMVPGDSAQTLRSDTPHRKHHPQTARPPAQSGTPQARGTP